MKNFVQSKKKEKNDETEILNPLLPKIFRNEKFLWSKKKKNGRTEVSNPRPPKW